MVSFLLLDALSRRGVAWRDEKFNEKLTSLLTLPKSGLFIQDSVEWPFRSLALTASTAKPAEPSCSCVLLNSDCEPFLLITICGLTLLVFGCCLEMYH